MNESLIATLVEYGLSENESHIYLCVLEVGRSPASSIARRLGRKRTTVYTLLEELVRKGIAQFVLRKKTKYYSVITPKQLLHRKEQKIVALKEKLPLLEAVIDTYSSKPKMEYYEGLDGLKELYSSILDQCDDEIVGFIGAEGIDKDLEEYLYTYNIPKRVARKIHARILISDTPANKKYAKIDKKGGKETRLISQDLFTSTCEINIFGEKIAMIMYSSDEMYGIILTSSHLSTVMKNIFEFMWSLNKGG